MAVNTPIQGTAADIARRAMVDLIRDLGPGERGIRLVLQVHDSLVCQVPRERLEEATERLRRAMEGAAVLSVPLETVSKSGASLADL